MEAYSEADALGLGGGEGSAEHDSALAHGLCNLWGKQVLQEQNKQHHLRRHLCLQRRAERAVILLAKVIKEQKQSSDGLPSKDLNRHIEFTCSLRL